MLFHFKVLLLILLTASVFVLFSTAGKIKNIPVSKITSYRSSSCVKFCNRREAKTERVKAKSDEEFEMKQDLGAGK